MDTGRKSAPSRRAPPLSGLRQSVAQSRHPAPATVVGDVTADHVFLTSGRLLAIVWQRETTIAGIEIFMGMYREHIARMPDGFYLLSVVEDQATLPAAHIREALANSLRSFAGHVRMSALVHEGSGFRAAAVRSVVTGIAMLSRLPYPHQVFATVEQAAAWLSTTPHDDLDPDDVVGAVRLARFEARQRLCAVKER